MLKKIFIDNSNALNIQLFRSIFVGGLASIIDIAIFLVLIEFLNVYYLLANILSFSIGMVVNYFLTIKWVFTSKSSKKRRYEFLQFSLIGVIGLMINQVALWLCTDIFSVYVILSKIIATLMAFIWNFFARKHFVF